MAADAGELLQLEAKSKEDHSWHPCQVFLSLETLRDTGLSVDFGDGYSEEIISNKEDVFARLRPRSVPLLHGECIHIKEGEHVLAICKKRVQSLFFDASVEKVWRVKHSNKVHCRCKFEIRWLHPDLKGETVEVPSSSLKKLCKSNINEHPIIAEFLKYLNPLNNSNMPSDSNPLKNAYCETDLHLLLDKQIEEISKMADDSVNSLSEDILFGIETVNSTRHTRNGTVMTSPRSSNNSRRFTRSQSKLQHEGQQKDTTNVLHTPEDHPENLICLSPLAARAALASLLHECPKRSNMSYNMEHEKRPLGPSEDTHVKQINTISFDITDAGTNSYVCVKKKASTTGKKKMAKKVKLDFSTENGSSSSLTMSKRLTQSAVQQDKAITNEVNSEFLIKDGKANGRSTTRSRSCSALKKEMEKSTRKIGEVIVLEDEETKNCTLSTPNNRERNANKKLRKRPGVSGATLIISSDEESDHEGRMSVTSQRSSLNPKNFKRTTRSQSKRLLEAGQNAPISPATSSPLASFTNESLRKCESSPHHAEQKKDYLNQSRSTFKYCNAHQDEKGEPVSKKPEVRSLPLFRARTRAQKNLVTSYGGKMENEEGTTLEAVEPLVEENFEPNLLAVKAFLDVG